MTTRRRFITIAAVSALCGARPAAAALPATVWRGIALGAPTSIQLVHPDRDRVRRQLERCVAELRRLEGMLSLYRADSAICRLNAQGRLPHPPHELVELLSIALAVSRRSGGAFDPTVQPLYRLYAEHFARPGAAPGGPPAREIERVRRRVDHTAVAVDAGEVTLLRPGMALTLNGIAQGYITDRVAELLRAEGWSDLLVDLGEARALGRRPDGAPWTAAIAHPRDPARSLRELALGEGRGAWPALATSSGLGSPFGPDPGLHHLLDPHSGRSANHHLSVSVAAPRATLADALSTTLAVAEPRLIRPLLAAYPEVRAFVVDADGALRELSARRGA